MWNPNKNLAYIRGLQREGYVTSFALRLTPSGGWLATLTTPFKTYEKEHKSSRKALARVCFMFEADTEQPLSCRCCHGTYCDMHDDPKSSHYNPPFFHIPKCEKCEGLGSVGDPQHGHSQRCSECDGSGKRKLPLNSVVERC